MQRGICGRCGTRQNDAWRPGRACLQCSGQVNEMRLCPWCTRWVAFDTRCSGCALELLPPEDYPAARMGALGGVQKDDLPGHVHRLSRAERKESADLFLQEWKLVQALAAEISFCERFLVGKGFTETYLDQEAAQLPWDRTSFIERRTLPLVPLKGRPVAVLHALSARARTPESRELAQLCLMRLGEGTEKLEPALAQLRESTLYGNETLAAFGHWTWHARALRGYYGYRGSQWDQTDLLPLIEPLLNHPVYRSWAATAYLATLDRQRGPRELPPTEKELADRSRALARKNLRSGDRDLAFSSALALGLPDEIAKTAKRKNASAQSDLARRWLISHGGKWGLPFYRALRSSEQVESLGSLPHPPSLPLLGTVLGLLERNEEASRSSALSYLKGDGLKNFPKPVRAALGKWLVTKGVGCLPPRELLEFLDWALDDKTGDAQPFLAAVTRRFQSVLPREAQQWFGWTIFQNWLRRADDSIAFSVQKRYALDASSGPAFLATLASCSDEPTEIIPRMLRIWNETPGTRRDPLARAIAEGWPKNGDLTLPLFNALWKRFRSTTSDRRALQRALAGFGYELENAVKRDYTKPGPRLRLQAELFPDRLHQYTDDCLSALPTPELGAVATALFALLPRQTPATAVPLWRLWVSTLTQRSQSDPGSAAFRRLKNETVRAWKRARTRLEKAGAKASYDVRDKEEVERLLAELVPAPRPPGAKPLPESGEGLPDLFPQAVEDARRKAEAFFQSQITRATAVIQATQVRRVAAFQRSLQQVMAGNLSAEAKARAVAARQAAFTRRVEAMYKVQSALFEKLQALLRAFQEKIQVLRLNPRLRPTQRRQALKGLARAFEKDLMRRLKAFEIKMAK